MTESNRAKVLADRFGASLPFAPKQLPNAKPHPDTPCLKNLIPNGKSDNASVNEDATDSSGFRASSYGVC
ncbi:MAG TPA: hypothetical protein DCG12_22355 [Planctomycetaceae bacterium]|nr:hypothetical protein [Planctomycetaceae bacterium]